ncbi:short-chain dehydrogenase [Mycolicibacterium moriokaense]|uniref:Short-chain dehydrogenase n=1 Tax=Mycolicibacterium moriokaense TaxID=39691 RepID=A0AAD1M525_9MYCO|nr:SDR family oxidoreductase [Mycolicibacterium moriokaense]MCV7038986.1 SDR family oxidoreductase [Mycolicibacterium moriokaense]ORB20416.1 short-chain dehydrogenase [Mycolicibacterium moriokaense]BBW99883.1 short-chain dehydrogenase [Mycolicibacterium moriokaense]
MARASRPNGKINGKVVAITGGARGIGLATAKTLHRLGAKIAIGDIDEAAVKDAGSEFDFGFYARLDVTDRQSFTSFLDDVERELGPVDVLVNNAGICVTCRFLDEPDELTERTLAINVTGVILGTKLAAQRMVKRGKGHIINVASLAGLNGVPGIATYCATKHAVLGYTDTARMELRGTGVHASAILPTLTNTGMIDGVASMPGMRNAEPEDIAAGIVSLIEKPKPRMIVTRQAGVMMAITKRLPLRLGEAVTRALNADRIFADAIDKPERREYEDRARHS